jgi:hypothetical protein
MGRACSTHEEKRNSYRILVGKQERKRLLGRPKRMWEDGITTDLGETGSGGMGCTDLAQDRDQWRAVVKL